MADAKKGYKHSRLQVPTPKGIARFPSVHTADGKYGDPKFKTEIVWDGDADLSKLTEAALKIAAEVWPKVPANKVNVLIKDGDEETGADGEPKADLAGKTFLRASCKEERPPQIVGPDKKPLTGTTQVRGGDEIALVVSPIACDTPVKHTVSFRLLAVQLVKKNSGGGDYAGLFEDEGEGFGSATPDDQPSSGVDAGEDTELPF